MKREPDFYGTAKGESKGMVSHRSQREGVGLLLSFPLVHTKHCNVAVFSIYWDEILLRHEGLWSAVLFETRSCA